MGLATTGLNHFLALFGWHFREREKFVDGVRRDPRREKRRRNKAQRNARKRGRG